MNTLEVEVTLPKEVAEACVSAVGPETASDALTRSEIRIEPTEKGVKLKVEASDLHALRAAANTYLRWVIMCAELAEKVK
jgi:tRNA threonylcarbamoyladenosine modification (KEOPS) complex  Pcc1 subunit